MIIGPISRLVTLNPIIIILYSHQLFVADADIAGNNIEFTVGYWFPLHPSKEFVDNDLYGVINKKTEPYNLSCVKGLLIKIGY